MNAFIDANGVLVSFSHDETNGDAQAIPVADDFCLEAGKWRWNGSDWEEAGDPVPTAAQVMAQRNALLDYATQQINPLQDLVDIDEAAAEDVAKLLAWKKYRAAVGKVSSQSGFPTNVVWPVAPT